MKERHLLTSKHLAARDILRNGRGNHVAASAVGSTDLNPAKNYILGAGLCPK